MPSSYSTNYLLSCGSNARGQLGNGTQEDCHTFARSKFAADEPDDLPPRTSRIVDMATGGNHTFLILELGNSEDGARKRELWGCGDGRLGQLGLDYQNKILAGETPTMFRKITLDLDAAGLAGYSYKFIAATWETSYAVLSCEGRGDVVLSFGSDGFGDLGVGSLKSHKRAADPKGFYIVPMDRLKTPSDLRIPKDLLVVDFIFTGQRHVILQMHASVGGITSPVVVGWGSCRNGQLGGTPSQPRQTYFSSPEILSVCTEEDPIKSSAMGIQHTVFLHSSGRLSGVGSNRKHQLEAIQDLANIESVAATWNGTYAVSRSAIDEGWKLLSSGSNTHGQLARPTNEAGMSPVHFPNFANPKCTFVSVVCGSEHVLAMIKSLPTLATSTLTRTELWGWGWNEHGNLGIGHTEDVPLPFKIWPCDDAGSSAFHGLKDVERVWAGSGTSWILGSFAG